MRSYDRTLTTSLLEQTNYLNLERFKQFTDALPKLLAFHSEMQKPPMDAYHFQMLYKIAYHCAFRISEALNVKAEDFDIEHRVVKLPETKTGYKHCKCSKWKKRKLKKVDKNCPKCQGIGKVRVTQKTSIGPLLLADLAKFLVGKKGRLFNSHRATAWKYAKQAGDIAGLKIHEEQKQRSISGVWTHLFRKSYAKLMEERGANPSLIMLKGRWSPREMYQTYTKPDLNYLISWEAKAFA